MNNEEITTLIRNWVLGVVAICTSLTLMFMTINPPYQVWSQRMHGEAELAKASQTRMIQIEQAKGEKEAAELRSQAISIIGKAAKEFPEYRQQEFIGAFAEALKEGKIGQIIYVPTEANIPLMEAGKRK